MIFASKTPKHSGSSRLSSHGKQQESTRHLLTQCFAQASGGRPLPSIIRPTGGGKPYFRGSNTWHFNVSHSGDFSFCGVDTVPLGVDVQVHRSVDLALVARVCTPFEQTWLQQNPEDGFSLLWVLKESYVKATGEGVGSGRELAQLDLPLPRYGERVQRLVYGNWYFTLWHEAECSLAVCTTNPNPPALLWH